MVRQRFLLLGNRTCERYTIAKNNDKIKMLTTKNLYMSYFIDCNKHGLAARSNVSNTERALCVVDGVIIIDVTCIEFRCGI